MSRLYGIECANPFLWCDGFPSHPFLNPSYLWLCHWNCDNASVETQIAIREHVRRCDPNLLQLHSANADAIFACKLSHVLINRALTSFLQSLLHYCISKLLRNFFSAAVLVSPEV